MKITIPIIIILDGSIDDYVTPAIIIIIDNTNTVTRLGKKSNLVNVDNNSSLN